MSVEVGSKQDLSIVLDDFKVTVISDTAKTRPWRIKKPIVQHNAVELALH